MVFQSFLGFVGYFGELWVIFSFLKFESLLVIFEVLRYFAHLGISREYFRHFHNFGNISIILEHS